MGAPSDELPCTRCGLVPAAAHPIRRNVAIVLARETVTVERLLCRDHGRELTASFLRKTLLQGWWGLTSLFINVFVVVSDLVVLRRYGRLAAPSGVPWANRPGGVPDADRDGQRPPAWHPDPSGRHEQRWYDGAGWTARVRDGEATSIDAIVPR